MQTFCQQCINERFLWDMSPIYKRTKATAITQSARHQNKSKSRPKVIALDINLFDILSCFVVSCKCISAFRPAICRRDRINTNGTPNRTVSPNTSQWVMALSRAQWQKARSRTCTFAGHWNHGWRALSLPILPALIGSVCGRASFTRASGAFRPDWYQQN